MSPPYFASAAGETIKPRVPLKMDWANSTGKSPSEALRVNSTVSGSTARIDRIWIAYGCAGEVALSMCRWV